MRLPSLLCTGLQEFCAGSLISWEKSEPKRALYLPVSYVSLSQRTYSGSASSWKPITMPICEAILKSPQAEFIPDPRISTRHLDQSHTHPSLKYAVNDATQGSWLKLWDTALDYGAAGTHQALAILQALTTPLFGDRKCPLPQLVHISCDRKYKHTPWPRHGTPLRKCPLSHPRNPQTSHRQSWKGSASWPAHSQNSVYTLFRLLNIFASICSIVIKFWFTKALYAFVEVFLGYSLMEHPWHHMIRISLWNMVY